MRTTTILAAVLLSACNGVGDPSFGGTGGDGGGSAASTADVGMGGAGGADATASSTGEGGAAASSSSSAEASSSSSSSSSSSTTGGGPVSECDGAERGAPCTEGGGHLCDGAGVCVEYIGVRCKFGDGTIYVCGDGIPRKGIITDTTVCNGGVTEWPYAPPGERCIVTGVDGHGTTV